MSSRNWNDRFRASLRGHLTRMRSFSAWNRSEKPQARSPSTEMAEGSGSPPRDPPHFAAAHEEEYARGNEPKRKRFRALRAVSRIFRRKSTKRSGTSVAKDEQEQGKSMKSRSTSELLVRDCPDDRESELSAYSSGLSLSHDSIFAPESDDGVELCSQRRMDGFMGGARLFAPGLQDELMNKMRERQDSDVDDAGLPHSPCTSPTTADILLHDWGSKPGKLRSSDGSLISMGSSETDNEDGATGFSSSRLSFDSKHPNIDPELDVGATTLLSNPAARHKIAVRPKGRRAIPQHRCLNQVPTGRSLPTTPEDVEETSVFHPSPLPRSTIADKKPMATAVSPAPRKSKGGEAPLTASGTQGLQKVKEPVAATGPSSSKSHAASRKLRHEIERYGQRHLEKEQKNSDQSAPTISPSEFSAGSDADDLTMGDEATTSCFSIILPGSRREKKVSSAKDVLPDEAKKLAEARPDIPRELTSEGTAADQSSRVDSKDSNRVVIAVPSDVQVPPATEAISTNTTVVVRPRSGLTHRLSGRIARLSQQFEGSAVLESELNAGHFEGTATQKRPHSLDDIEPIYDSSSDLPTVETRTSEADQAPLLKESKVTAPVASPRHVDRKIKQAKPRSSEAVSNSSAGVEFVAPRHQARSYDKLLKASAAEDQSIALSESSQNGSHSSDLKMKTPTDDAGTAESSYKLVRQTRLTSNELDKLTSEYAIGPLSMQTAVEVTELRGTSFVANERFLSHAGTAVRSMASKQNIPDVAVPVGGLVNPDGASKVELRKELRLTQTSLEDATSPSDTGEISQVERRWNRKSAVPRSEDTASSSVAAPVLEQNEPIGIVPHTSVRSGAMAQASSPDGIEEHSDSNVAVLQVLGRPQGMKAQESLANVLALNSQEKRAKERATAERSEKKTDDLLQAQTRASSDQNRVHRQPRNKKGKELPTEATKKPGLSGPGRPRGTTQGQGQRTTRERRMKESPAEGPDATKRKPVLQQLSREDIEEIERESETMPDSAMKILPRISMNSARDTRTPAVRPFSVHSKQTSPVTESPPVKPDGFGSLPEVLIFEEHKKSGSLIEPRSPTALAPLDIQPYAAPAKVNGTVVKARPKSSTGVVRLDVEWEGPHGTNITSTSNLTALPDKVEIPATSVTPKAGGVRESSQSKTTNSAEQSELFQVFRRRSLKRSTGDAVDSELEVTEGRPAEDGVKSDELKGILDSVEVKSVKSEAKIVFEAVSPTLRRHRMPPTNKIIDRGQAKPLDTGMNEKKPVSTNSSTAKLAKANEKSSEVINDSVKQNERKASPPFGSKSTVPSEKKVNIASQVRPPVADSKSLASIEIKPLSTRDVQAASAEQRSAQHNDSKLLPSKKRSVVANDVMTVTLDNQTSPTSGSWKSMTSSESKLMTTGDPVLAYSNDSRQLASKHSPFSSNESSRSAISNRSRSSSSGDLTSESKFQKSTGLRPSSLAIKEAGYKFSNSNFENGDIVKPTSTSQKEEILVEMRRRPVNHSNIVIHGTDTSKVVTSHKEPNVSKGGASVPKDVTVSKGGNLPSSDHGKSFELPSPLRADGNRVPFWKDLTHVSAWKGFHSESSSDKQKVVADGGGATRPFSSIVIDDLIVVTTSTTTTTSATAATASGSPKKVETSRTRSTSTPIGPVLRQQSIVVDAVLSSSADTPDDLSAPSWMRLAQQRRENRKQQQETNGPTSTTKTESLAIESQAKVPISQPQPFQAAAKTSVQSNTRLPSTVEIVDKTSVEDCTPQWKKAMQQRRDIQKQQSPSSAVGAEMMIIETKQPGLASSPAASSSSPPPSTVTIPASAAPNRSSKVMDMVSSFQRQRVS